MTAVQHKYNSSQIKTKHLKFLNQFTMSAMVLSLSSFAALAQETNNNDQTEKFEQIVITGSNIRGTEVIGNSVLTIDEEDIAKSGRATIGDYLRELPSNLAGGVGMADEAQSDQDTGAANANLSGGQGVNLRGLGALSTLVLVNGRRMATAGQFGDFVDISNIPSSAIERVEVLQDGASAIYGSDAVGGVVNIILKRHLDGPVTSFRVGTATEGGGQESMVSHMHNFDWEDGNAVVGFEVYKRDEVKATDRDIYSQGSDFSRFGGVNWAEHTAHVSPLTNIFLGGSGTTSAPVGASVPQGTNDALTMSDLTLHTDGSGNTVNVYEMVDILPSVDRTNLFASFDQDFDNFSIFGDIRYTDRTSNYDLGYADVSLHTLPTTSPYYIDDIDPSLTGPDGSIAFGKYLTDKVQTRASSVKHYSGQLGINFDLTDDWGAEVVASYARDKQSRKRTTLRNPIGNTDMIGCALGHDSPGCDDLDVITWNPFSTDPLTDAQIAQYYGYENLEFDSEVTQLSAKADGSLFSLSAGNVMFALGVDFREEVINGYADFNTVNPYREAGPYEETKRDAMSAFVESYIPVTDTFTLSVAGRYEKFSGTGDYSTFNPKFGFDYKPVDGVKIRGSWGTSFHAPAMRFENDSPEPLPGGNSSFLLNTSRFAPCDNDLVALNGLVESADGSQCSFTLLINSGGAGEGVLSPEESESWTVGIDFEPDALPGFRASFSYFDITVENRIQRIQSSQLNAILVEFFETGGGGPFSKAIEINLSEDEAQALLDAPKFLGTFGPPFANTASDIAMVVNATQLNIAALSERGIDYSLSYDFTSGDTDFGLFFVGTYLTDYSLQTAPGLAFESQLGKYSSFGSPVELRAKQGIDFSSGDFDGRITVNYTSSYECDVCYVPGDLAPQVSSTPIGIDAWVTVDVDLGWDISDHIDGGSVNFRVTNLFNEDAPFIDGGTGVDDYIPGAYDPNNHTIVGQTISLQYTQQW